MSHSVLIFIMNASHQLYYRQVKIVITYEGTNILVRGAFLKCFSIYTKYQNVPEKIWKELNFSFKHYVSNMQNYKG